MTPREHQVLGYLERYVADAGYAPTFTEIAAHLGVAGKSGVHRLLTSLERQGRIARDRDRPRAITILRGIEATGTRATTDLLAAVSTDALRAELNRRKDTNHG